MPTYAYACKDCGHAFDIQQSFSDDSLTMCPECRGKLRKKFNSVGVVFKGTGFYRTDSRSGSSTVPAAANASGSGSSSASDSSGSTSGSSGTESGSSKSATASGAESGTSRSGASKTAAPLAS